MSVSDVPVHELCREECYTSPNALSSHSLSADEEKSYRKEKGLNSTLTAWNDTFLFCEKLMFVDSLLSPMR